ncbi:tol-pal system YbgF family protein [Spirosoma fluviale]|uniref:Uncharacterized protein n=1 Tax=Spirosoma fluviale TaxID=1597977 RepID=A0A286F451_9BACT|nr:hypothetical protein [Spirosoma fluviale]SOD78001.1 hypothetical protein SAMN06269250_0241 [Spirosoma fluviale]
MDTKEEQYERIERYLANSLSTDEQQAFERTLQQDPVMAHEVLIHRHLYEAIRNEVPDNLMARALQKAANDYFADESQPEVVVPQATASKKSRHVPSWYWMAASVGLALVMGAGLFYVNNTTTVSNQELVAGNFTVYEAPAVFRSGGKDEAPILKTAFVAYNQKEYRKAIDFFQKSLLENPRQVVPNFYIGQCKLALHDAKGAIPAFQKVVDHGDNAYVVQAKWYLALGYIDLNQKEQASSLLRELSQQGGPYGERATRMLNELSN